ncbi:MAG TPA: sulfatase-like hydrolase/transferase [Acidobacteriaceae bacterium]|nr:sulfatase-like hydrolase/transferase [Acidobacteriaceae bacterium]
MREGAQGSVGDWAPEVTSSLENAFGLSLPITHAAYVLYWVLAGVLLRAVEAHFFITAGYADIDFLLAGILALFLHRRWIAFLVTIAVFIDFLACFAATYYFSPQDIPYALESTVAFPAYRLAGYAVVLLAVLAGLTLPAVLLRRALKSPHKWRAAIALISIAFVLKGIDKWGDYRLRRQVDAASTHTRLLRIPEHGLMLQVHFADQLRTTSSINHPDRHVDSAFAHGLGLLASSALAHPNIVEILVESWGQDENGSINRQLLAFYDTPEIRDHYRIVTGAVPFTGGTAAGEIRELCASRLGVSVIHAAASDLIGCIPYRFRDKGYRTESVHGYLSHMYLRYSWHPKLGFDQSWFLAELHGQGLRDCPGAFPGICDAQVARWIGDRLTAESAAKGPPEFLFWITLNSHLPVPSTTEGLNPVSCAFDAQLAAQEPLCAWFKTEYEVHEAIAQLAVRPDLPPTAFFVVGDHAPPFQDAEMRDRFSQSAVPFVLLIPKSRVQQNAARSDGSQPRALPAVPPA